MGKCFPLRHGTADRNDTTTEGEEKSGLKGGRRRHDDVAFIIITAATTFIPKTLRKTLLLLLDLQSDRQTQLSQKIFTKKIRFPNSLKPRSNAPIQQPSKKEQGNYEMWLFSFHVMPPTFSNFSFFLERPCPGYLRSFQLRNGNDYRI